MTPQQKAIIALARDGRVTKKEVVARYKGWYYTNAAKHIGDMLPRMVKAGMLIREKPGVFLVGKGTKDNPATIENNQIDLF